MTPTDDIVRRWHVLAGLIQQFNLKTFVEVGCKDGSTTNFIAEHCPDVKITAIDPWIAQPENKGVPESETYMGWDFSGIEAEFRARMKPFGDRVTMLRKTSAEAAQLVESADLVFIDALHDYAHVCEDIDLWLPKATRIIAGHDYNDKHPGVMRAVAEKFCLMDVGISPDSVWFVFKGAQ